MMIYCLSVNNAGFVLGVEKIGDISEADFEAMFNVNVFGLIRVTQLIINGTGHAWDRRNYRSDLPFTRRLQGQKYRSCHQHWLDSRT